MEQRRKFESCFIRSRNILTEGALAERLKREFNVTIDEDVALASIIYKKEYTKILKELFIQYIRIANKYSIPIMLTTPTRRANRDRVLNSKYNENIIRDNVDFLKEVRDEFKGEIYIGGLMGCRGDAYKADDGLSEEEAYNFHLWQAELFKESNVDFLYAGIMPTIDEAIGMAMAMKSTGLPHIISFMIRKDGKLIDGTSINDAILFIDRVTNNSPMCYMTNCVHPDIVYEALSKPFNRTELVNKRFKGIQANAACSPPEELDNSTELISSNPESLANSILKLYEEFDFKIFGGCCGTDDKYMEEIAKILKQ